jgi:hypothetical protein
MKNAVMKDSLTAIVTYPVDVWFAGARRSTRCSTSGLGRFQRIRLDPSCRFPDRNPSDNYWPRSAAPAEPPRLRVVGADQAALHNGATELVIGYWYGLLVI